LGVSLAHLNHSGRLAVMSDTDVAEILKLPPEERLRLLEIIWASLAEEPSSVPLGDAHRAIIDERLAEHESNPNDVVSRDEVLRDARRG
jgi:putative addiction module component (TIGR02574 family)